MTKHLSRKLATLAVLLVPFLFGGTPSAQAQSLTATFTYPTDGAVNVNLSTPIQWTTVENAQAYYLYLGTSLGAKDLKNSGELQSTSYTVVNLPATLVYARLWTKVADRWRFVDITFTSAPTDAIAFVYPAPAATHADMRQPFEWTPVTNVQAYYLYVGTGVGLKDLLNTGELQTTSYLAYNLPVNQTLFVRLWAKADGTWRFLDRTFTATHTATQLAQFINPTDGATDVNVSEPITWTTAVNADKYYLYVGSTLGAKDFVNSGELTGTSYLAPTLPGGQTLYARLWTRAAGVWRSTDITFTAASGLGSAVPTFVYPTNGSTMDVSQLMTWTSVANAQAYYLYVGTTPGAKDVINSGETQATSWSAANLPTTGTFYARIYAKLAGVWRYNEIAFSTSPLTASLITPANGSTGFDPNTTSFQWTSVSLAQKYYLYVGTTQGAKDLIDTEEICDGCNSSPMTTTWNPLQGGKGPGLGQVWAGQTLYARLWTMVNGTWRFVDSTFTTKQFVPFITFPTDGSTENAPHITATWTDLPGGATKFRVTVDVLCDATHPCSKNQEDFFIDSGELDSSVHSFDIAGTPARSTLILRVYALVDGVWRYAEVLYTHSKDV
jgi:hypothetical protein